MTRLPGAWRLGLLLMLALPLLSSCWRAPARRDPLVIRSPHGDRSLLVTTGETLIFEVRDIATGRTLHRQQTRAASRLAWALRWLDNRTVWLDSSDSGGYCWQEQAAGAWSAIPCPQFVTVQEGTLLRLDGGWEVGLQMVYAAQYTDAAGQVQDDLLARVSVWDGQAPQAEALVVHEGSVFAAGGRCQVVTIAAGRAARLPGTAGGSMTMVCLP